MSKRVSKQYVIGRMQRLSAGLRQHLSGQLLTLAGQSVKVEDVLDELDGYVGQLNTTDAAHANWLAEVKATQVLEDGKINPRVAALENYLRSLYGASSQTLDSFGMTPRKVRARTVRAKAESAAKSAATRVARHTLGPRQKAAIHGVVAPPSETAPPATPSAEAMKRDE
jgi:hypothetical protein